MNEDRNCEKQRKIYRALVRVPNGTALTVGKTSQPIDIIGLTNKINICFTMPNGYKP